ncbi:cartilage matrix protein-like [Stylophora pistillata]|nr:cartilage matrix protein-like [Stylophora pistillata]
MAISIFYGCLLLSVIAVFTKDAFASNWNIADSSTARKSSTILNENSRSTIHHSLEAARTDAGSAREDVPKNETCRDDKAYEAYCKAYRQNDFCNSYPYGMNKHCALTCGFCKCKAKIDIGFLVDSSGSIEKYGKGNYKKCLEFIKNAVNRSFISETFTHVGVVLFSSKTETVFTLKQFFDAEQMMKAIEEAPYLKGGTLTAKALTYVKRKLFDETGRPEVPKVLIVMTDGKSSDNVTLPAQQLHDANITVFAIGIGRNYDMGQLKVIATKPDIKYALTADFNRLNELYTSIRDDACRVNSTFSDQDKPFHTPVHNVGDTSFSPHDSHSIFPSIAVL